VKALEGITDNDVSLGAVVCTPVAVEAGEGVINFKTDVLRHEVADTEAAAKPKKASAENMGWQAAGLHCSANERRADEASRDVEAWLKCKYMYEHLGEEYSGVVTSATSFGLFVTLDAMYVEGLVHITELGGEYFRFDEVRQELRGERTGIRYAIGTRVDIQVSRVDLDGRKIDFRLVQNGLASGPKTLLDRVPAPSRSARGKAGPAPSAAAPSRKAARGKSSTGVAKKAAAKSKAPRKRR
jgi:ribonuclease R